MYQGTKKIDGNDFDAAANPNENRQPFKAILDIGIRRPTAGNRVFAVMKGACDGGLNIPHSTRKFPGFSSGKTKKTSTYDAGVHKKRIYGNHIDEYMTMLKKED